MKIIKTIALGLITAYLGFLVILMCTVLFVMALYNISN